MTEPWEEPSLYCDDICEDNDVEEACGCVGCGYVLGAAVAFGLMGMAEAIRRNGPPLVVREYWTSEIDGRRFYTCFCPGCGAYMKYRKAGEDEGTDNEWCGACRD